jgi:hypothetical protein
MEPGNPRILIYTTKKSYQADLLKQILAEEGINSFVLNKMDSSYLFGDIEMYVAPDDVIRAKALIRKLEES